MLKILYALKSPSEEILSLLKGHQIDAFSGDQSFNEAVSKNNYDLILLEEEIDSIMQIKATDPRAEVILFGDHEANAVEAISAGAFAYFTLPVDNMGRIQETIDIVSDIVKTKTEVAELENQLTSKYTFAGVVGKNPQMLDIFTFMRRIAPYFRVVTIMGETGTGKEKIAKTLHEVSPAAKHPFITVNCGALGKNLIESELFGHRKGSFTGALADKTGLFEAAGEGTIFLDEIGELPLAIQPHLLRVLQDGEFRPIGSTRTIKAKCNIIAATNRDLIADVKKERFREDLFYRLTPLTITLPPLRTRKDELPHLCRHFLRNFSNKTGKKIFGISRPSQAALFAHDWPGNVRMLESVLEHAAIMTKENFIRLEDLPSYIISENPNEEQVTLPLSLDDVIKTHIEKVLRDCDGNRSKAAEKLNINRNALLRKMKRYSIT
ncbi:MAG: sigma-54 dependent transcriptional regulator [Nitrospirota bacterium]